MRIFSAFLVTAIVLFSSGSIWAEPNPHGDSHSGEINNEADLHAIDHNAAGHDVHKADEHGGEHHGGGFGKAILFQSLNFLILALIIYFAARKGIKSYFYQRSVEIRNALEAAKEAQREAEEKSRQLQDRMAKLEGEIQTILDESKKLAQTEQTKILEKAKDQARRIREDAQRQISQEVEEAKARISAELAGESLTLVENLLNKELNDTDQKKLFDDFIGQVDRLSQDGSATGASR